MGKGTIYTGEKRADGRVIMGGLKMEEGIKLKRGKISTLLKVFTGFEGVDVLGCSV